ncbi:MAG TPA: hypothetical protein VFT74_09435, partial [Isosphaeraceae bacterium]|nr:hypothetical protein [Isosphaeraceae bacterium]
FTSGVGWVNLDRADDTPDSDREWWVAESNRDRADFFVPGEPAPLPSDADAPPECEPNAPPDAELDSDAVACMNAYMTLDRLCADRPVSIVQLNCMRRYFDYDTIDAECCRLLAEPHCGCGTRIWRDGLTAYVTYARESLAELDRYFDALAAYHFDPAGLDREHSGR